MTLSFADRTAITDLIARHGHLVDAGELDRMHELFTADITYDLTDFGRGLVEGLAALHDLALATGDANPVGHHITNTVLTEIADNQVHARSKGISITANGTCGSVTYEDTVVRGTEGWRINHRKIVAHRAPLGAK